MTDDNLPPDMHAVLIVEQTPDAIRFRTASDDVAHAIGKFRPARYDRPTHVFEVPRAFADQLDTFLRHEGIAVHMIRTTPTGTHPNTAETRRILDESRARAADAEHQAEVNARGLLLCKVALAQARLRRERQP